MAVSVPWLFLAVRWVGLWCVIVLFPDYTHLLSSLLSKYVIEIPYTCSCSSSFILIVLFVCLFDLILYVPVNIGMGLAG